MNDKVKEITDKIAYATLATVSEGGQPWNSPVWSFHDDALTYYWCSWKENQHSKNIRATGKVFIVVYDSTVPEGTGEGVYIQGRAREVSDVSEVQQILAKQAEFKASDRDSEEFLDDHPRRWYVATPEKIWLNVGGDVDGNYVDVRKEVL